MPRCPRTPSYRRNKPSNQAVVTIDGHDVYLGKRNSPESHAEYNRLISEWLVNGRRSMHDAQALSINDLMVRYLRFVEGYYVKDGKPTSEQDSIRQALRPVKRLYVHTADPGRR